jgi:hypothetical protein
MFQGNCLCLHLLCTSEILFTSIKMRNNLYQLYFIYNLLWSYLDVLFQEQTNIKTTFNGKRYESMFCSMYVVTSVTTSSLTETILIARLFPICCQVSTTCKHLCFPIIPKFKELYNKKLRNGINVCIILTDQADTS